LRASVKLFDKFDGDKEVLFSKNLMSTVFTSEEMEAPEKV
jgi:hypothetical protein